MGGAVPEIYTMIRYTTTEWIRLWLLHPYQCRVLTDD